MLHKIKHIIKKGTVILNNKWAVLAEKTQTGKRLTISVSDLFFMQFDRQELKRYDIVVRYLAVENYFGENDFGFDLYRKMQDVRIRHGYGEEAEGRFRLLIDSYVLGGYNLESSVIVDKNLSLIDGSHRLALHLYMGIENINVLVLPVKKPVDYSTDWFFQKGFSDAEIDMILAKERELKDKFNCGFAGMIWSPATSLSKMILKDMMYFGKIDNVRNYVYSLPEYQNVVKAIYAVDDIETWKIQKKLEHMKQKTPEIVSFRFRPDYPDFRIKDATGMPLSKRGERMKKLLRERFKPQIEDYYFDIILHMADNYQQSAYMFQIIEPNIDMEETLKILSQYSYALTKTDSPYYPADFPCHIPVGKDVDILCVHEELNNIVNDLRTLSQKWRDYEIRVLEGPKGTQIRIEKMGQLIFLFDVLFDLEGLAGGFVEDALKNREWNGEYMRLSAPYEYINRIVNYQKDTRKTHHLEYLKAHRADFDAELLKKYTIFTEKQFLGLLGENKRGK